MSRALRGRTGLWLIALILSAGLVVLFAVHRRPSDNPAEKSRIVPVPLVAACSNVAAGVRRTGAKPGDRYMLEFDIPENDVAVREDASDALPLKYGYSVRPKDGHSLLLISYGPQRDDAVADRAKAASPHLEKRVIVDDRGRTVGDDDWGYSNSGKRWRRVRFQGWVTARYDSAEEKDAELFDRVINSACLLPASGS